MHKANTLLITGMMAYLGHLAASEARDRLPLGHPDFYPSPQNPIGWRGDGNGAFPGATVVDHFADGPVKTVTITVKDKRGKEKQDKKVAIDRSGNSTNIAWKYALPGFTHSQAIVVGHRAIITCEPRTILCINMNDGKEMWRQELCPFRMLGLEGDKRDQALALENAAWTLNAMAHAKFGNYTRLYNTDPKVYLHVMDSVREILNSAAAGFPAEVKKALAPIEETEKLLTSLEVIDTKDKAINKAVIGAIKGPATTFTKLFHNTYKFCASQHWYSYVGWTWPTPVCDGTWLYIYMGQGQIAKVAVADGSIGWFRKLMEIKIKNQPLPRSPLLHDGVFIIPADDILFGLDAETGKELWRYDTPSSHHNSGVGPKMMKLDSGRWILASPDANNKGKWGKRKHATIWLHDPKTGKVLAEYHHKRGAHDPGPSLMTEGNYIYSGFSGFVLKIKEDGDDLSFEKLWEVKKGHGGNVEVLHKGLLYRSDAPMITDLVSGKGKTLPKNTTIGMGEWKPGILVGDRIVGTQKRGVCAKPTMIEGLSRLQKAYPIHTLDGQPVSDKLSLLETASKGKSPRVAPQASDYLDKGIVTTADITSICAGIPGEYSYGALYAHGNRLLIPSNDFLYCIGDPSQPFNGKAAP